MKGKFFWILPVLWIAALLASCQSSPAATAVPASPTPDPSTAVTGYFDALSRHDFPAAVDFLSDYSLKMLAVPRDKVAETFQPLADDNVRYPEATVDSLEPVSDVTQIANVHLKRTVGDQAPEDVKLQVPLRLENGVWKINYNQLVDDHTFTAAEQVQNNVAVKPVRALRFTNILLVQFTARNDSDRPVRWGHEEGKVATFTIDGQAFDVMGVGRGEGQPKEVRITPAATVKDIPLWLDGYYASYPSKIELFNWESEIDAFGNPGASWTYTFDQP